MWRCESPQNTHQFFHRAFPESGAERHVHLPVLSLLPLDLCDLCDLCSVGRPHLLQEKSLRLRGPRPGSLLLSWLRQQAQQPVPGPERTHPLPQRCLLALRLPAVPLPGQYNRRSLGDNMEPLALPHNHQNICRTVAALGVPGRGSVWVFYHFSAT